MKTIVITYDPDQTGHRLEGEDETGKLGDLAAYLAEEFNDKRIESHIVEVDALRVVVGLEGGLISGLSANVADVDAVLIDYDTEGANASDGVHPDVPQSGGGTAEAFVRGQTAEHDEEWVNEMFAFEAKRRSA
jgi:hypothetical protein